eukprot:Gregarina_sp_Poly_1__11195@NODE_916_length_5724_cov_311_910553_g651_i0_p1_GENE_NODE_916_length_5724_cov_311_910553_g651_i0NODE_916_length_5724_cov_311_910553_g651_i0_p1_ORF_typecomplete_len1136_score166_09PIP5K/PF01504_18/0_00028_NODE_916_length_5724_cov_311_910553_g651_i023165414
MAIMMRGSEDERLELSFRFLKPPARSAAALGDSRSRLSVELDDIFGLWTQPASLDDAGRESNTVRWAQLYELKAEDRRQRCRCLGADLSVSQGSKPQGDSKPSLLGYFASKSQSVEISCQEELPISHQFRGSGVPNKRVTLLLSDEQDFLSSDEFIFVVRSLERTRIQLIGEYMVDPISDEFIESIFRFVAHSSDEKGNPIASVTDFKNAVHTNADFLSLLGIQPRAVLYSTSPCPNFYVDRGSVFRSKLATERRIASSLETRRVGSAQEGFSADSPKPAKSLNDAGYRKSLIITERPSRSPRRHSTANRAPFGSEHPSSGRPNPRTVGSSRMLSPEITVRSDSPGQESPRSTAKSVTYKESAFTPRPVPVAGLTGLSVGQLLALRRNLASLRNALQSRSAEKQQQFAASERYHALELSGGRSTGSPGEIPDLEPESALFGRSRIFSPWKRMRLGPLEESLKASAADSELKHRSSPMFHTPLPLHTSPPPSPSGDARWKSPRSPRRLAHARSHLVSHQSAVWAETRELPRKRFHVDETPVPTEVTGPPQAFTSPKPPSPSMLLSQWLVNCCKSDGVHGSSKSAVSPQWTLIVAAHEELIVRKAAAEGRPPVPLQTSQLLRASPRDGDGISRGVSPADSPLTPPSAKRQRQRVQVYSMYLMPAQTSPETKSPTREAATGGSSSSSPPASGAISDIQAIEIQRSNSSQTPTMVNKLKWNLPTVCSHADNPVSVEAPSTTEQSERPNIATWSQAGDALPLVERLLLWLEDVITALSTSSRVQHSTPEGGSEAAFKAESAYPLIANLPKSGTSVADSQDAHLRVSSSFWSLGLTDLDHYSSTRQRMYTNPANFRALRQQAAEKRTNNLMSGKGRRMERKLLDSGPRGLVVHFGHESWNMVLNMMVGIRLAAARASVEPMRSVEPYDFLMKEKFSILPKASHVVAKLSRYNYSAVRFIDYAPMVFRKLRETAGLQGPEYLRSVGPEQLVGNMVLGNLSSMSELCSEGKSGALFYYTADGRFLVKTVRRLFLLASVTS